MLSFDLKNVRPSNICVHNLVHGHRVHRGENCRRSDLPFSFTLFLWIFRFAKDKKNLSFLSNSFRFARNMLFVITTALDSVCSVCQFFCQSVCLLICLSGRLFVRLSVCVCVSLCLCLSVSLYLSLRLFLSLLFSLLFSLSLSPTLMKKAE